MTSERAATGGPDALEQPAAVEGFAMELRPGPNDRELLVVVSPSYPYSMRARRFSRDTLFVADLGLGYFIQRPMKIATAILDLVERRGYRRVLFTGVSKAGFAALMLGGLCARARPRLPVRVLAFSPQTRLFPDDPAVTYPMYRALQRRSRRNRGLAERMRRFGDLSHLAWLRDFHATIAYPMHNAVDAPQALRMTARNVRLYPLDSPIHGSALFFAWQGAPVEVVLQRLERLFGAGAETDQDIAATRPADLAAVARAVVASRLPTFEQLIDEAIAVERLPETVAGGAWRTLRFRLALARRALRRMADVLARAAARDPAKATPDAPAPGASAGMPEKAR